MNRPRTALFWQKLFIYCWVFSVAGHIFELLWAPFWSAVSGQPPQYPRMSTIFPLALPYGLGIVAVILFVIPLMERYKLKLPAVFALNVLAATVVEYLSAVVVVALYGTNTFWDYSSLPFNVQGYVSLGSSLVFGVLASAFAYGLYPRCEAAFARLTPKEMTITFWALLSAYALDVLVTFIF